MLDKILVLAIFALALFVLGCGTTHKVEAPKPLYPWDSLPSDERARFLEKHRCLQGTEEATKVLSESRHLSMVMDPWNNESRLKSYIVDGRDVYVLLSYIDGAHNNGEVFVMMGSDYGVNEAGEAKAEVLMDYYMVRHLFYSSLDGDGKGFDEETVFRMATGKYFCYVVLED